MPSLPNIVQTLESGPGGVYASRQPPSMAVPAYGQYPAFVSQYGAGAAGVNSFAQATLAANPNATVCDFYAGYVLNTGAPGAYSFNDLQSTNVPGAQGAASNFLNNAGVSPDTPLSSVMGGSSGGSPGGLSIFGFTGGSDTGLAAVGNMPNGQYYGSVAPIGGYPDGSAGGIAGQGGSVGSGGTTLSYDTSGAQTPAATPWSASSGLPTDTTQTSSSTVAGGWEATGASAVSAAGKGVSQAIGSATSGATNAIVGAGSTWLQSIFGTVADYVQRGGIFLLGMIFVIFALIWMMRQEVSKAAMVAAV
jgi:hypothetical protein